MALRPQSPGASAFSSPDALTVAMAGFETENNARTVTSDSMPPARRAITLSFAVSPTVSAVGASIRIETIAFVPVDSAPPVCPGAVGAAEFPPHPSASVSAAPAASVNRRFITLHLRPSCEHRQCRLWTYYCPLMEVELLLHKCNHPLASPTRRRQSRCGAMVEPVRRDEPAPTRPARCQARRRAITDSSTTIDAAPELFARSPETQPCPFARMSRRSRDRLANATCGVTSLYSA